MRPSRPPRQASAADHAFISSDTGGNGGRDRVLAGGSRLGGRLLTWVIQFRMSAINCSISAFRSAVRGSSGNRTGPPKYPFRSMRVFQPGMLKPAPTTRSAAFAIRCCFTRANSKSPSFHAA